MSGLERGWLWFAPADADAMRPYIFGEEDEPNADDYICGACGHVGAQGGCPNCGAGS